MTAEPVETTPVTDLLETLRETEKGIAEAVRVLDLMGRGGDARNLERHRVNIRAVIAKAGDA